MVRGFCIRQTHEKGWDHGQIRHALWRVAAEDGEEDGSHTTRKIYLFILWQGRNEAQLRGHLVVQALQAYGGRRCVGLLHNGRLLLPVSRASTPGSQVDI